MTEVKVSITKPAKSHFVPVELSVEAKSTRMCFWRNNRKKKGHFTVALSYRFGGFWESLLDQLNLLFVGIKLKSKVFVQEGEALIFTSDLAAVFAAYQTYAGAADNLIHVAFK